MERPVDRFEVGRQLDAYRDPVTRQLLEDTRDMLRYASDRGIAVPEWLGNALAKIGAKVDRWLASAPSTSDRQSHGDEVEGTTAAPVSTASDGRDGELELKRYVRDDLEALVRMHGVLTALVHPATPVSIRATHSVNDEGRYVTRLGTVRMVPQMLVVGLACVLLYVVADIVEGHDAVKYGDVTMAVRLLAAAGCGAVFYNVFTVKKYITSHTYDPSYQAFYWSRLVLGILSGFILSQLLGDWLAEKLGATGVDVGPVVLALLGGFSAEAVHQVLRRLVDAVVSAVRGSTDDLIEVEVAKQEARLERAHAQWRDLVLRDAVELRSAIDTAGPAEVQSAVNALMARLLKGPDAPPGKQ